MRWDSFDTITQELEGYAAELVGVFKFNLQYLGESLTRIPPIIPQSDEIQSGRDLKVMKQELDIQI